MITQREIQRTVRRLGLSRCPVCLHSSLRSFGEVVGGAASVVQAFLEERCTLLVPTFSWNYAVPPPPAQALRPPRNGWDYGASPGPTAGLDRVYRPDTMEIDADMGAIPATVVRSPVRMRGRHALNSFSALGPFAGELIMDQAPLNVYAPLDALARSRGAVLLIGVGLEKMTLLHLAEKQAGRTLFRRWANDAVGQPMALEVGGCSEGFGKLAAGLRDAMETAEVGPSLWRLFPAAEALAVSAAAIRADPRVTHCPDPECGRCCDAVAGGPILTDDTTAGDHPS